MSKKEKDTQPTERELVADELESRILFSAAPVDVPDQAVHEVSTLQSLGFESLDALSEVEGEGLPLEPYFAIEGEYHDEVIVDDSGSFSDAPRLANTSLQSVYGIDRTLGLEEVTSFIEETVITKSFN